MLYVGIDVAKRKHDCFITNSDGEALEDIFTIQNSKDGFEELQRKIKLHQANPSPEKIKVGLEATGHYSDNLVRFLSKNGLTPIILNPLKVNLYRKGESLRKTKTDKSDARFIAHMLIVQNFEPHTMSSYHNEELKSLTRHRQRMVKARSVLKVSYDRLLSIVFPELEGFVRNTQGVTELKLLSEFPNTEAIAGCHLSRLTSLVEKYSHGRHDKEWAINLRDLAKNSIGSNSPAKAFELKQTIRQMDYLSSEINLIDSEIKTHMIESETPIMTIPGIGYTLGAVILAEIGNITRFDNPSNLQAFAGLDPTTYQSGQFTGTRNFMVKRGSTYLRWAVLMAARGICRYDPTFEKYLERKISEGKHYNSAMGHVAKKLLRVIYHIMSTNEVYVAKV